jgi:hypothetical protein
MASLFHIHTTDCPAGQHFGMRPRTAFADAWTVKDEMIAPAGRRRR